MHLTDEEITQVFKDVSKEMPLLATYFKEIINRGFPMARDLPYVRRAYEPKDVQYLTTFLDHMLSWSLMGKFYDDYLVCRADLPEYFKKTKLSHFLIKTIDEC